MANLDKGRTVTLQELLVTSLAQTDWQSSSVKPNKLIRMPPSCGDRYRPHHLDTGCARHWERQYA